MAPDQVLRESPYGGRRSDWGGREVMQPSHKPVPVDGTKTEASLAHVDQPTKAGLHEIIDAAVNDESLRRNTYGGPDAA